MDQSITETGQSIELIISVNLTDFPHIQLFKKYIAGNRRFSGSLRFRGRDHPFVKIRGSNVKPLSCQVTGQGSGSTADIENGFYVFCSIPVILKN